MFLSRNVLVYWDCCWIWNLSPKSVLDRNCVCYCDIFRIAGTVEDSIKLSSIAMFHYQMVTQYSYQVSGALTVMSSCAVTLGIARGHHFNHQESISALPN